MDPITIGVLTAGIISGVVDTAVNADQASKNRNFQREMAKNNIKYAVSQAQDLGISPSLVLGDATHSLGGANSNVSNISNPMSNAVNSAIKYDLEKHKLETLEEINEDKLQTFKDIQAMKNNHSARVTDKQYTKKDFDNFFTDLSKVDI